ncbi:MAG: hypothetical protein LBU65_17885, partial [Planctomycetaceae bacterium]|nr:hypothetical protein [Planctomycetaceae bacterium]
MSKLQTFIITLLSLVTLPLFAFDLRDFQSPPDSARPWVYWFIMDGNLSKEGITADFEAMQKQGIGGIIMMEVNNGVPRGDVGFMSEKWQQLFAHIVHETERLGLQLTLNSGPGWTGSGGPWITPEQSMLHLVASEKRVHGGITFNEALPVPTPRRPFFGEGALPAEQEKARKEFFKDVRVLAFPTPQGNARISDIDEKAVYVRAPYSSAPNVKPGIAASALYEQTKPNETVNQKQIIDLTDKLNADGVLNWNVPEGDWTILRFAATTTGANTRPAPQPGLGLESSKMDRDAFDIHYDNFIGKLFKAVGERQTDGKAGWCYFHIDSWEMGPQNFSKHFIDEFRKRRGYDPIPFLPAYTGIIVENREMTERFLWDIRQTSQELIVENHGEYLKELSHKNGLKLSIEPYDMMPCCDMTFGSIADVPMCEFWSEGYGFDTFFSCLEAASIAHTHGLPVVGAEAFTSSHDKWRQNPKSMKRQGDWAFCAGVNRITFHRFQHQPFIDRYPGFSMGIHGVHWDRTQTWWNLVSGYHQYLARCQYLLQQGDAVADILYLLPEGAPRVFTPPKSATMATGSLKDQRGYRFDGCDPPTLIKLAAVKDGHIVFDNGGTKYRLLVLPKMGTMTLPLLQKIELLVRGGATVVGNPPVKSPSLEGYPEVDEEIRELADTLWNKSKISVDSNVSSTETVTRSYGKGRLIEQEPPIKISGAKWIWHNEGNPNYNAAHDAPAGTRFFRKTLTIDDNVKVVSARLLAVADNDLIVRVNGTEVHKTNLANKLTPSSFLKQLKTGKNVIELEAANGASDQRNPAGVIAAFEVKTINEQEQKINTLRLTTDKNWESSSDSKKWAAAQVLGNFGMPPWSVVEYNEGSENELYPDYSVTEKIFANDKVLPDFESEGDALRFFHRRDNDTDIYFIANKSNKPYNGTVKFRVECGKQASILDPLTGRVYRPNLLATVNGRKEMLTLPLDAAESVFVIFDAKGVSETTAAWKGFKLKPVMQLDNGWTIKFDSKWNAPEKYETEKLFDWST